MRESPAGDAVTIIIVAYNSHAALQQQLPLLAAMPRIIVVDNASSDGTSDWLPTVLPQVQLLRLPENVGFGRAHNHALAYCETPFALLLNPDCLITPTAIATLCECLVRHDEALIAVPRLVYADGSAQENHRGFFHTRGRARPTYKPPEGEICCEMVSGAVLLVRVALMRRLSGFDPWFFLYWEDEDLCLRARQQGLAVILAPEAEACHVAQTSSAPSLRGTFVRHYSYTSSKIYLRRKLGQGSGMVALRALGTFVSSFIALPFDALSGRPHKAVRSLARMAAVATAPLQLRRKKAVPLPSQLWRD